MKKSKNRWSFDAADSTQYGNYGSMTGNVYWKYNNYVGNKPDAGSKITIFSCDTARNGLKYEASTDVQGNYRIEKVLPGEYFMVIRSGNTTDCPEDHLRKIKFYTKHIKQFYDFDINEFQPALDSISALDSFYHSILLDKNTKRRNEHLTRSEWRRIYSTHERLKRQMAADLLNRFPKKFMSDIEIYTEYGSSHDYTYILIKEDENVHENTDFGTTCI